MVSMLDKHREFEAQAKWFESKGAKRFKEKNGRGVNQHVVELGCAILRWPCEYEGASTRKVRYEPLISKEHSLASGLAEMQVRKEIGL